MDKLNKLKCADQGYMKDSIQQFQEGVNAYNELDNGYKTVCLGKSETAPATDFTMYSNTTKDNSTFNISDTGITCGGLRDKVIEYGRFIDDKDRVYTTQLTSHLSDYNTNKNALVSRYNTLTDKRQKLDQDVLNVLGADNSPIYEKQGILDSAVYTTLLWTVLATSVLYYTFTKI